MIAPTGTIGLVMDCDTTGIEPDFALVKFKKLAGGGYFKIINRMVPQALQTLGYDAGRDRGRSSRYAVGHGTLGGRARRQSRGAARPRASATARSRPSKQALAAAFDISFAFNKWTLGEEFCTRGARLHRPSSSTMSASTCWRALGFTKAEIEAANTYCCGAMTLEGAPHLKERASVRSSTAPTRAGASASASSRSRATSA